MSGRLDREGEGGARDGGGVVGGARDWGGAEGGARDWGGAEGGARDWGGAEGVAARKAELRARCRAARAAIPATERARLAGEVEEHLFALPAVRDAGTVMLFSSLGAEVPTAGMAKRLWREGRRVALPAMATGEIEPVRAAPDQAMARSSFGPLEPVDGIPVPLEEIDVVVVPGLAFDRGGNRLGQGGGHYDRFLRRLPPRPLGRRAVRVGIGFGVQVLDQVPAGPEDEPVDVVVTDAGTVICRPGG